MGLSKNRKMDLSKNANGGSFHILSNVLQAGWNDFALIAMQGLTSERPFLSVYGSLLECLAFDGGLIGCGEGKERR